MARNHKQNSNFQISYFLAGSCHTADGAFSMLCDLKESREAVIANYEVSQLKEQAKIIRAQRLIQSEDSADKLDGQAELLEIENNNTQGKILFEAAEDELSHINKCLKAVEPLRQYSEYSDLEAHELAQREEWLLELINRAENYMITGGSIPSDHFVTMRMHPDFKNEIIPRIEYIKAQLSDPSKSIKFLKEKKNTFELPKLLN